MMQLTPRQQSFIGLALALLMILTRGQHLAVGGLIPDASWAVFFLAGAYLAPVWALPAYMLLALGLDYGAITWGGVNGSCLTPAYLLLVPAHAILWGAGRWYAGHHSSGWSSLWRLSGAVFCASVLAETLASGGFYLFSGHFPNPSSTELVTRLVAYYPQSLAALALYVGTAAGLHGAVRAAQGPGRRAPTGG